MTRFAAIAVIAAAGLFIGAPAIAQSQADEARFDAAQRRFDSELSAYRTEFDRYQAARSRGGSYRGQQGYADPRGGQQSYADDRYENGYDPARYYRDGRQYQERALAADERVYAGTNGQYYCRRSDGTTGLIVGAAGGGVLGNVIDGGHSRTAGTLLGAAVGALAGRAVQQSSDQVRCR